MTTPLASPRVRSGRTKRLRTREALLAAALARFADSGWERTRMEDVARDAGVGVATAYTHFSKQTLIGHVYAPLLQPLLEHADADVAAGRDPVEALTRHVHELVDLVRSHHNLTLALLRAVQDRSVSAGAPAEPGDMDDVRVIVPAPKPMERLIDYGQRVGRFSSYPTAAAVATYHTNAAMVLLISRARESAAASVRLVLSQLLPALLSPPPQPAGGAPDRAAG